MTETPDFLDDEDLYRRIVESSPAAVTLLTNAASAEVLYASPRIEEISGFSPRELIDGDELWDTRLHPDEIEALNERWARAVEAEEVFVAEYRFRHRNGEWRWFRETSAPVRERDGSVRYRQSFTEDITPERFAEAQAERSEARYRALVERLPVIVYVDTDDVEPRSLYVSPNAAEILGYEPSDFLADADLWLDSMHPDDRQRIRKAWAHAVTTHEPFHAEYRNLKPDGTVVWVRDHSILVRDDEGRGLFWQGVLSDITAERDAAAALHRSEQRHRALVEQVPAIMYEMGPDDERRTLFVSPHVEQLLGYARQEWLDQPDIWQELLHPDDRETELAALDRHNETGEPWQREYRLIASDGREVWVSDHAQLVDDAEGPRWLGVMLDITPQKHAEELLRLANDDLEMRVLTRTAELEDANEMMSLEIGERRRIERELRATQDRYRTIVEGAPAAVYTWEVNWEHDPDPPRWEQYTSPQIEEILGFPPSDWHRPGFWKERVHPHDRERIVPLAEHSATTGEPFNAEYRYLAADGRVVWVLDRATLRQRNRRGEPRMFQGVMLDITARKEAEEKAAIAEERFQLLAERGPVVFYLYELRHGDPPTLDIQYVSPSAEDLLSMPIERWKGDVSAWMEHMHPDDVERMRTIAETALATGRPWNHVFRMIAGDGRIVWLLDRGRAIEWDDEGRPRLFQGVFLDVTAEQEERQALEASEARYRSVIETLPAVPWTEVTDPVTGAGRYVFIGPQVEAVFGYTPTDLMMEPDHFFRLVHPDDRERVMAASDRCDATGEPWDQLYRVFHRDGSVHWIFSFADRTFEDDRPVWHGISIDVTRHVASGAFPVPAAGRSGGDPG